MTFPDPTLGRPIRPPSPDAGPTTTTDIVPPTERNQDPLRAERTSSLVSGAVEPKAEDRAESVAERVYAPASERVPKEPVPGHREVVEHTDTHTPEREAAMADNGEPTFTRVPRPSGGTGFNGSQVSTTPGAYASPTSNPGLASDATYPYGDQPHGRRQKMFLGIGASWMTMLACGVGVWLFMRWRAERNKPINRLRRQARQAWEMAGRMPLPGDEAARPAAGVGSALIPIALLIWRASQQRSRQEEMVGRAEKAGRHADKMARRAAQTVGDVDWQHRLMHLKQRWNPARLDMEKVQISRR